MNLAEFVLRVDNDIELVSDSFNFLVDILDCV